VTSKHPAVTVRGPAGGPGSKASGHDSPFKRTFRDASHWSPSWVVVRVLAVIAAVAATVSAVLGAHLANEASKSSRLQAARK